MWRCWCRVCSGRLAAVHNWAAPVRTHGSRRPAAAHRGAGHRRHRAVNTRPLHSPAPPRPAPPRPAHSAARRLQQLAGRGAASPVRTPHLVSRCPVSRYLVCWRGGDRWAGLGWAGGLPRVAAGVAWLGWAGLGSAPPVCSTASPPQPPPGHQHTQGASQLPPPAASQGWRWCRHLAATARTLAGPGRGGAWVCVSGPAARPGRVLAS